MHLSELLEGDYRATGPRPEQTVVPSRYSPVLVACEMQTVADWFLLMVMESSTMVSSLTCRRVTKRRLTEKLQQGLRVRRTWPH